MYQYRSSIYIDPSDSASVKSVQVGNQRQDQIRYLTDQLQTVMQCNERLEKENSALMRNSNENQEQAKRYISRLTVLLSENEKLQEIVVNTNKQLKQQQTKTMQLQQENCQLKCALQQSEEFHVEEMKKRTGELEEHYQLMQQIVADLTGQVKQLCEEKEKLQKELDDRH